MGATFKARNQLSQQQQNELFIKLAKAVSFLHNTEEIAHFLRDILSEPEVIMLAKRLQIAEMLSEGMKYREIREKTKISFNTIAKVQTWLELYGDGYRVVIKRMGKTERPKEENASTFARIKRKYPMYYWPELLLEEIVKSANKREKERLLKVVGQLREKTHLSKELTRLLST